MNYSDIANTLAHDGIDVALPGARQGVCSAPYVVVQDAGTFRYAASAGLCYTLFAVHCYVPLYAYGQLDPLIARVRASLASLAPDLRSAGSLSPHLINDHFRAHQATVHYLLQRKL